MPLLESEEAARRLGVKLTTLYAYVSRGLLESHRSPDSRRSLFELADVERLAARARQGKQIETRLATVNTSVTQIGELGPIYRGRAAIDLVGTSTFEEVAELLWEGSREEWPVLEFDVRAVRSDRDRLRLVTVLAGASDPLRADRRPAAVQRAARTLIATAARHLGDSGDEPHYSVAAALAGRISRGAVTENLVAALDAALILLADHELAASTLAVRIAASTRADFYDAVLCGLGVSGPLHLGASGPSYDLLVDARTNGPAQAIDHALVDRNLPPGFGHAVYTEVDPRLTALLPFLDGLDGAIREVLDSVLEVAERHDLRPANIDLGLGALALAVGTDREFGATAFAIARIAGWTAHYLEECGERPVRFRTRAVYINGTYRRQSA